MNEPSSGPEDENGAHHAAGVPPPSPGDTAQRALGERDDRARRRQRHDHDHKQRFRVVDAFREVVLRRLPAFGQRHGDEQHHRPQPEHHFDFTEEMQDLGPTLGLGGCPGRQTSCVRGVLHPVRQRRELRRDERVHDRQQKDRRRHRVERIDANALREQMEERVATLIGITQSARGNDAAAPGGIPPPYPTFRQATRPQVSARAGLRAHAGAETDRASHRSSWMRKASTVQSPCLPTLRRTLPTGGRCPTGFSRARRRAAERWRPRDAPCSRILTLETARAVADHAMAQREVLRARRCPDRIGLHKAKCVECALQARRREETVRDRSAPQVADRHAAEGERRRFEFRPVPHNTPTDSAGPA